MLKKNFKQFVKLANSLDAVDLEDLTNKIIETGNAITIIDFAKGVKGVNIKKLEDAIIKIGDEGYYVPFVTFIKGADVDRSENEVIKKNIPILMIDFVNNVKRVNFSIMETAIVEFILEHSGEHESLYAEILFHFAENHKKKIELNKIEYVFKQLVDKNVGNKYWFDVFNEEIKKSKKKIIQQSEIKEEKQENNL